MTLTMPETSDTFGNLSLVALSAKPTNLAAATVANITAGKNITCHMIGDWWPTASTEKVTRSRKMCQTKVAQGLGTTTHETPALQYTYLPQATDVTAGNEAKAALTEGTTVYLVQRIGKVGTSAWAAGDHYRLFPVELGPQVPGTSSDDAGGESVMNQEIAFAPGYDGPVNGILAA